MSWSFWFNVVVCAGSLYGAWLDHWDTYNAVKSSTGVEKKQKVKKLILLWGLPVFSIAALPFTVWESLASNRELAETRTAISKIDPLKQPVSEISALVKIKVGGKKFPDVRNLDSSPLYPNAAALLMLCHGYNIAVSSFPFLVSDSFIPESEDSDDMSRSYLMHFHSDKTLKLHVMDQTLPLERLISEVRLLRIDAWLLPHDSIVLGGSAVIIINSATRITFNIPPQKNFNPLNDTMGNGFILMATNTQPENVSREQTK